MLTLLCVTGEASASVKEDEPTLMADGKLNVLGVEGRMARTVWQQLKQFAAPSGDSQRAGVKESMLHALAVPVRNTCRRNGVCHVPEMSGR